MSYIRDLIVYFWDMLCQWVSTFRYWIVSFILASMMNVTWCYWPYCMLLLLWEVSDDLLKLTEIAAGIVAASVINIPDFCSHVSIYIYGIISFDKNWLISLEGKKKVKTPGPSVLFRIFHLKLYAHLQQFTIFWVAGSLTTSKYESC